METHDILQVLGIASGFIAVGLSIIMVRRKVHARAVLLDRLSKNAEFIHELSAFEEARDSEQLQREIDRLDKLIQAQLASLDKGDRERIEASLHQSSQVGRVRFIGKLASDASHLQHAH